LKGLKMFEHSILEDPSRARRPWTFSVSALFQSAVAGILILVPLLRIEALPPVRLEPPPPLWRAAVKLADTPRAATVAPAAAPRRQFEFRAPTAVPASIAMIDEPVPGFGTASVLALDGPFLPGVEAFAQSTSRSFHPVAKPPGRLPPPPPAKPAVAPANGPVRVGGDVKPPVLLREVKPGYPRLAIQTRTQGVVQLEAVIGRDGRIRSLRATSGHPLLVPAALAAVQQWLYRPTLLNGEPVEVALAIDVNFTLAR
jgi:periplasmic protein TonB